MDGQGIICRDEKYLSPFANSVALHSSLGL